MRHFTDQNVEKGNQGEQSVSKGLKRLPPDCRTFNNLVLPVQKGTHETTQVDHVVTSRRGMFVIETKTFDGTIAGGERDDNWVQFLGERLFTFRNPIRQNVHHVRALQNQLGLPSHACFPIVVFVGTPRFATPGLPPYVVCTIAAGVPGLRRYIEAFPPNAVSPTQLLEINRRLRELSESGLTLREHLCSLRSRQLKRHTEGLAEDVARHAFDRPRLS